MMRSKDKLYDSALFDLAREKKWTGKMKRPDLAAQKSNPRCGDEIEVFVRLKAGKTVEKISHQASACVLCLASANAMGEAIRGLSESETRAIHKDLKKYLENGSAAHSSKNPGKKPISTALKPMKTFSGVREYASRISCVLLPWETLALAWEIRSRKKRGSVRKNR
ncbi:MAG: iron-sulfur cluster assembly scaffold protein, partial [Spirochaetia bacterium]|nr:iron-sulfur cluster assembly scaffold protein [Spirochaetia bacterium]